MTCQELANDQMLAPTAEVSSHLAGCGDCRERQKAVMLAARALRAMAGESEFPESKARAIREAIPQLAADAARRRPAAWWQVAAAAAVLVAAVGGALHWAREKPAMPSRPTVANTEPGKAPGGEVALPPDPKSGGDQTHPTPIPDHPVPPIPVKPPDPVPPEPPLPRPPGGTGFVARGPEPVPPAPPDVPQPKNPTPPPEHRASRESAGIADCMQIVKGLLGSGEPVSCDLNGDGVTGVADAMLAARLAAAERRAR